MNYKNTSMKMNNTITPFLRLKSGLLLFAVFVMLIAPVYVNACSSFKLQKGDSLVYGHNLNEGDIGVPGLLFVNKRSIYKTARTWSEIATANRENPSSFCWISRYGSVTFNNFGRDFPDGGMNEEGLFIWEMNDDTEYPKNENLPKLNQMNWMQFILDNCRTMEEAVKCAHDFEIDGWGWHFFVGDAQGNTAAIEFIKGEIVMHKGSEMPVPALFNEPYEREMNLLKYFKGFGGDYDPDLNDPRVPRFVKTAVMTRDYNPDQSVVDYGLKMLEQIKVDDEPEWSVLFDVRKGNIYFKTRINPEVKTVSFDQLDFSNNTPTTMLNIDIKKGGNIAMSLEPFSTGKMESFTREKLIPLFPPEFFTRGGITLEEYIKRVSLHTDLGKSGEKQFFKGTWKNNPEDYENKLAMTIKFESDGESIRGSISNGKEFYPVDHLQLIGNRLKFTFKTKGGTLLEIKALFDNGKLTANLLGTEDNFGSYLLVKK